VIAENIFTSLFLNYLELYRIFCLKIFCSGTSSTLQSNLFPLWAIYSVYEGLN